MGNRVRIAVLFVFYISLFGVISFGLMGEIEKLPIVVEGELIPGIEGLVENMNRSSPVESVVFSPDGKLKVSG